MSTQSAVHKTSLTKGCFPARYNETQYFPWDNPYNIVSQDVEALVSTVTEFTLALLFLIGGPANILNMLVFYKQGLQDRVNLCLFMLAVSDNLFLTSSFYLYAENIYLHLSGQVVKTPFNKFISDNNLQFLQGSAFVSFILSAIIACERCYCVLRPLKYQTLMRTRTMAVIILLASVVMLSMFFLVCYRYQIQCLFDPVTGEVFMMPIGGEFYATRKQFIDYVDNIFFGEGVPVVVMVVVITTTITTIIKLRQITTWRTKTSTSLSLREVALTKMLIGNSVLFIICISPMCVFRLVCFFLPHMTPGGRHHNFFMTTLWILEGTTYINSSFSFFIYYLMGSRYRETLWALFGKKTQERKVSN